MAIDRHLIWDNIGSLPPEAKLFGKTSTGRLWSIVYQSNFIRLKYSDDDGENWSTYEQRFSTNISGPSMFIDSLNAIHIAGGNSTYTNSPRYDKRNGSWSGTENVKYDVIGGNDLGRIIATNSNQPYCVWRNNYAPRTIRCRKRNGSWGNEVTTNITTDWQTWNLSACIDQNDIIHVAWFEREIADSNHKKVMTARFSGGSWSSHTTLDEWTSNRGRAPRIVTIDNEVWAIWCRDGVGVETSYSQIRYARWNPSTGWGSVQTLTDFPGDHDGFDVVYCAAAEKVVVIYEEIGSYAPEPTIENLVYQTYNGLTWSSKVQLTEESQRQVLPNTDVISNTVHMSFRSYDGANWDIYHGSFEVPVRTPDLTISSGDISVSPDPLVTYHPGTIYAVVHNIGTKAATDVLVRFYDGNPIIGGSKINGDQTIGNIPIDSTGVASVSWTPMIEDGTANIYVFVDPAGEDETAFTTIDIQFSPQDYYVSKTGNDGNDGTSWATAWLTVQHAVDNIYSKDNIYVGPGIFNETVLPPDFLAETIITGPDMEINTKFDGIISTQITYIKCQSSGSYTTWKNIGISYLIRTTGSVHDITFEKIFLAEGASDLTYDGTISNILFNECLAYNLAGGFTGFVSTSGIWVTNCIAYGCTIGITPFAGRSNNNCAYNCGTNFNGTPGPGSIEADPLFVDSDNDDFRLFYDSQCMNAGSESNHIGVYQGVGIKYKFSKKGPQNLGCNVGIAFAYNPYEGYGIIPLGDWEED